MRTQKKPAEYQRFMRTQKLSMLYLASCVLGGRRVGVLLRSGKEKLEGKGHSASDQEDGQEGEIQHAEQDNEAAGG